MTSAEAPNVDDLLFFPAKELLETNIAGRRAPPSSIRLAVGSRGVYKFESDTNKILAFWGFNEIDDWNFSGYSFTLKFKNKTDYYIRTDDGQAISHWIESFSTNGDQALVAAKQYKSLGLSGTMRKFSAELKPINQSKYYTLNPRRTKHSLDPTKLLSAYGVDKSKTQTLNRSPSKLAGAEKDQHRWSTGISQDKTSQQDSSQPRAKSIDSLLSNGVNKSLEYPSPPSTPSTERGESSDRGSLSSSAENTTPPKYKPSVQSRKSTSPPTIKYPSVAKQPIGAPPTGSKLPLTPPKIIRKSAGDTTISNTTSNTTSNATASTVENVPEIPPRNTSLHQYCTLEEPVDNLLIKVTEPDNQKRLSPPKYRPHLYEEVEFTSSKHSRSSYDKLTIRNQLDDSGEYDHLLPPGKGRDRNKGANETIEEDKVFSPIRRNESLPPMTLHSPLMKKKDDREEVNYQSDESGSDEEEELTTPQEGVVMRQKKADGDPFVDLLSAPPSKSRLRWSQELNPIYDYTRGIKLAPAISYEISGSSLTNKESIIHEEEHVSFTFGGSDSMSMSGYSDKRSSSESGFDGLIFVSQHDLSPSKHQRKQHNYEEIMLGGSLEQKSELASKTSSRPLSATLDDSTSGGDTCLKADDKMSSTLARMKSADNLQFSISPRINKRVIQQRRSKTIKDTSNAPQGRQRAQRMADSMKDFSYTSREHRLFYVKLPNGQLVTEVVNINRPVSVLIDRLMDSLGGTSCDNASIYVEGSVLTTMKEATLEFGEVQPAKAHVDRSVSLTQLVDSNSLAEQGASPVLLKNNVSFRMQNITTSRILRLDDGEHEPIEYNMIQKNNEFHKKWLGVLQGNQPCTLEAAVKLAAIQYQAYFLERTVENSVIGFCRPNDFLPVEYAGIRGIEQRLYKEQEKIKSKHQSDVQKFYIKYCCSLPTNGTIMFPVREPRRKIFQSTKLRPVLLGINEKGIMRVCPKSKEVLDFWEYQVLKNWAYSRRTFVIAFNDKNYPVESNQARWISELVDFFVESIIHHSPSPPKSNN